LNTVRSLPNATVIAVLEQLGLSELPPPVVDAFFTASMRRYVELGFGIALIAVPQARRSSRTLHERDMSRYFGRATVYKVQRKDAALTPAAVAFTRIVGQRLGS
jgi:DNA-binding transcriptional LysR family regulator